MLPFFGRSARLTFLVVLAALSAVVLLLAVQVIERRWASVREARALERRNAEANELASAISDLAFERGRSAVLLRKPDPATADDRKFLEDRRTRSDAFLRPFTETPDENRKTIAASYLTIRSLRSRVDADLEVPRNDRDPALPDLWFLETSELLDHMSEFIFHMSFPEEERTGEYVPMALLRSAAVDFRKQAGKLSSMLAQILARGRGPTHAEARLIREERRTELASFGNVGDFAYRTGNEAILAAFAKVETLYALKFRHLQDTILDGTVSPLPSVGQYLERSVAPLDSVRELLSTVRAQTDAVAGRIAKRSRDELRTVAGTLGALLLAVIALLALLVVRVASPMRLVADAVTRFRRDDLETPVPPPVRRDEFGRLLEELELLRLARHEREALFRSVREDEAWINLVLDSLPVRIMRVSRDLRYLYVNRAFGGLSGLPRSAVIGRTVAEILGKDLFGLHEHHMKAALTGRTERYEVRRRAKGAEFVDSVACVPHVDGQGNAADFFMLCVDVTERARLEERLNDLASRDPLTGAFNRRAFMERVESELERRSRAGAPLSFAIVDLDHFKNVNDTWGHAAGDEVLKVIAETCRRVLRSPDVFGRFGGEEFVALLPGADFAEAGRVAERLRSAVETAVVETSDGSIRVTLSAGYTTARPGDTPEDLLRRSDAALYESKRSGRNRASGV